MKIIINQIPLGYEKDPSCAIGEARRILKRASIICRSAVIFKRSVDARRKDNIRFVWSVLCEVDGTLSEDRLKAIGASPLAEAFDPFDGIDTSGEKNGVPPIVVGFGPAGMFASLLLAQGGYRPIVLERGGSVDDRVKSVESFMKSGILDTESNVQFGAGGAGTFSDGKLTTRINDPSCRYILETLVGFGAPEDILTSGKPHIGTDMLRNVVRNISNEVIRLGGTVMYDTRFDGLVTDRSGRASAVRTTRGEIACSSVILATGHSARDTYTVLRSQGFDIVPKSFSVGVRIEQLRSEIDKAVYGDRSGDKRLPTADYAFSWRDGGGCGVYTFCMCPGGTVVAAASEEGMLVTNGMSDNSRSGINSNAALVVSVTPDEPMDFQRRLEKAAYDLGGGMYAAPVQTVGGYLSGKVTEPTRVMPTYTRGVWKPARLDTLFDAKINTMLGEGLSRFARSMPAFAPDHALLTAAETRTSSPYRIMRRDDTFTAAACANVYPCGEGAGYAGGIMSAAADGIRCARHLMSSGRTIQ